MNTRNALVFASLTAAATAVLVACGSGSVVDVTDTSSSEAISVIQADAALTENIFGSATRLDSLMAFCKANPGTCDGDVPTAVSSSGGASSSSTGSSSSQGGGSSSSTDTPSSSSADSPSSSSTIGSSSSITGSSSSTKPSSSSVASSSSSKPSSSSAASSSSVASSSSTSLSEVKCPDGSTCPSLTLSYGGAPKPLTESQVYAVSFEAAGSWAPSKPKGSLVCSGSGTVTITAGTTISMSVSSTQQLSLSTLSSLTGYLVTTGSLTCSQDW